MCGRDFFYKGSFFFLSVYTMMIRGHNVFFVFFGGFTWLGGMEMNTLIWWIDLDRSILDDELTEWK